MKKYSLSIISFLVVVLFASCLKDKDANVKYGTTLNDNRAVFFAQGSGTKDTALINTSTSPSNVPTALNDVQINLAGTDPLDKDVTITIAIDNSLLGNSGLTPLPAGSLSIPTTVVLKAGTQFVKVPFTIANSTILSPTVSYGFGIRITAVDNQLAIISNKRTLRVQLNIKNKYDGVYENNGTFVDFVNPAFSGNYPLTYRLVTTGSNSVDVQLLVNGNWAPAYLFLNAGSGTFFGSYGLTMAFDPATESIIDFRNYYGDPSKATTAVGTPSTGTGAPNFASSNTRRAVLDPSGINKYDNATKSIKIKHFLIQTNQSTGTNPRSAFNETWTYIGPRP